MFFILPNSNLNFQATITLLSANAFNLNQSNILVEINADLFPANFKTLADDHKNPGCMVKDEMKFFLHILAHFQTNPGFYVSAVQVF